jgi:NADPH:quinone reductase-like Zn-dependent oxidoreductase
MNIYPIPKSLEENHALCVFSLSQKVYSAIFTKGKVIQNERVLVLNACSAYGYMSIQVLKTIPCEAYGESKDQDGIKFLEQSQMQFEIINSEKVDLNKYVDIETCGVGVDCVIDFYTSHSKDLKKQILKCLSPSGRWITVDSSLQIDPPDSSFMLMKNITLGFCFEHCSELYGLENGKMKTIFEEGLDLLKSGKIKPLISKEYDSIKHYEEDSLKAPSFCSKIILYSK